MVPHQSRALILLWISPKPYDTVPPENTLLVLLAPYAAAAAVAYADAAAAGCSLREP